MRRRNNQFLSGTFSLQNFLRRQSNRQSKPTKTLRQLSGYDVEGEAAAASEAPCAARARRCHRWPTEPAAAKQPAEAAAAISKKPPRQSTMAAAASAALCASRARRCHRQPTEAAAKGPSCRRDGRLARQPTCTETAQAAAASAARL